MKTLKILKLIFLLTMVMQMGMTAALLTMPIKAAADTNPIIYKPQVTIPVPGSVLNNVSTPVTGSLLANYIQAIYTYGMMIAGILAAIVLMGGGLLWLTSAGNDSKITQAKELISGSIVGLIILFGSWIILNTINPDLLNLKVISPMVIGKDDYCCDPQNGLTASTASASCPICSNNQVCLKYNGNFACREDNVCCDCYNVEVLGLFAAYSCTNDISTLGCAEYCKQLGAVNIQTQLGMFSTQMGWYVVDNFGGSKNFTCVAGAQQSCQPIVTPNTVVNNLSQTPSDTQYFWNCQQATCQDVDPDYFTLDNSICNAHLTVPSYSVCPNPEALQCCGYSLSNMQAQNKLCINKAPGAGCQLTSYSKNPDGYCLNNQCNPCKRSDAACTSGDTNYECQSQNDPSRCGLTAPGNCSGGLFGLGSHTCKYQ